MIFISTAFLSNTPKDSSSRFFEGAFLERNQWGLSGSLVWLSGLPGRLFGSVVGLPGPVDQAVWTGSEGLPNWGSRLGFLGRQVVRLIWL
ncbi:unnamed protein product [Cuscuta campestris]|uniref:Uncharacterized protein n=1 Tax=Cuscuta campestris TaxID=132261 RepID=A0A484MIN4_9ASTE|nr:unnamed protein product [Cuscuta campestris]